MLKALTLYVISNYPINFDSEIGMQSNERL